LEPQFSQVQESWWREQQVLPSRTHPTMSTPGTGGYLLSGIRVLASEDPPLSADATKRPGRGGGRSGKRGRR